MSLDFRAQRQPRKDITFVVFFLCQSQITKCYNVSMGKSYNKTRLVTAGLVIVAIALLCYILYPTGNSPWRQLFDSVSKAPSSPGASTNIGLHDEHIFTQDAALRAYMQKYGAKQTIQELHDLEKKLGSCHQPAHRAGHIGYQLLGNKALIEYGPECQSGYYHGVMEAYFKDHGTENLKSSLDSLCPQTQNSFFDHQCIHGIGHGLLAWTNYELPEALKACDELPRRADSCWTGAFMENLSAQIAKDTSLANTPVAESDVHTTKYLSSDPLYPCNGVDAQYQDSCYFLQTSRMLQIFGQDFSKIAAACATAPAVHQSSCYASMGRDVGGRLTTDIPAQIEACSTIVEENYKTQCLNGAVQNSFWDPSGQTMARTFCQLLLNLEEKQACYSTIFERASQLIKSMTDRQIFCAAIETNYKKQCQQQLIAVSVQ